MLDAQILKTDRICQIQTHTGKRKAGEEKEKRNWKKKICRQKHELKSRFKDVILCNDKAQDTQRDTLTHTLSHTQRCAE